MEIGDEEDDRHSTHSFPQRKRRRGLSQFYSKAQSFCCLDEAVQSHHGPSAAALEKKPKLLEPRHDNASTRLPLQLPCRPSVSAHSRPIAASHRQSLEEPEQLSHSCPSSLECLSDICSALEHSSLSGSECDEISRLAADPSSHSMAQELSKLAAAAPRPHRKFTEKYSTQTSAEPSEARRHSFSAECSSSTDYLP